MGAEFYLGWLATAALFLYQCKYPRNRLWIAQAATLACQAWICFGYFSPLVSKHAYEWQVLCADLITAILDCWAMCGLVFAEKLSAPAFAVVALMLLQRRSALEFYWNADAFRWPDMPALVHMRFATNIAYLVAIALLYRENGAPALTGEVHDTPRSS